MHYIDKKSKNECAFSAFLRTIPRSTKNFFKTLLYLDILIYTVNPVFECLLNLFAL
jgi:hypothetical protein